MSGPAQTASLALDGGDPRIAHADSETAQQYERTEAHRLHDPSVSIEEYMFYAALNRAEEERLHGPNRNVGRFSWQPDVGTTYNVEANLRSLQAASAAAAAAGAKTAAPDNGSSGADDEKGGAGGDPDAKREDLSTTASASAYMGVADTEWGTAARAARTASWGAIFYLITTDILGPFSVPWALSQMGWGPGVALYFIFGALAFYAGFQMWQMFMVLDSDKYPLKTYGDIAFRVAGRYARHSVNILQSIQLFFNVGILILSYGQSIYQLSEGPAGKNALCFVACNAIFTIAGFALGQVRTLRKFGWIANAAIWMNVAVMIITMAIVAISPPNYVSSNAQNLTPLPPVPIVHYVGVNPEVGFQGQVVGLMQAVYSYGGAMLYCEFMSEMKKPWDFFKAQFFAECFIFTCYIFFGCFVYAYQGQYTIQTAFQGISWYGWQSACNAIALVSALIAACLYGNIGVKVIYSNVLRELFGFPPLESKTGKLIWVAILPLYWILAFVVCSAIPNITNFSGLIGAACILQFSYTFPPIMMLCLDCQRDAILPEETFNPANGQVTRVDEGWARYRRGFFARRVPLKLWYVLFALGSAVTAVLGIYSSIFGLVKQFRLNPNVTAFGCSAPI